MKIDFTINKTVAQSKATPFINQIEQDLVGKEFSRLRILLAENEQGVLYAYFESIEKDSCLGIVKSEALDDIKTLLDYDYSIKVTKVENSKLLTATIETLTEEPKKAEISTPTEMTSYVSDGYMTEEDLNKRIAIANEHGIPLNLLKECVLEDIKKKGCKEEKTPLSTMYVDPEKTLKPKERVNFFKNAFMNAVMRHAFVLEGPKSVGKNVFCKTMAFLFNMEYYVIQLNENTSDGDVYGEKSTDNSAAQKLNYDMAFTAIKVQTMLAQGKTPSEEDLKKAADFELYKSLASSVKIVQALGVWVKWLQNGGVMCLNEMDMADANFFSQLVNMILDGTGFMTVPGYGRVDIHPDCILIGTQNGAEYAGTNNQNAASISRFDVYRLPQPKDVLGQLKAACEGSGFNPDEKALIQANEFYKDLLKKTGMSGFDGVLSDTCLNIRGMVRALEAYTRFKGFVSLKERLTLSVVNACADDERPIVLQSLNEKVSI